MPRVTSPACGEPTQGDTGCLRFHERSGHIGPQRLCVILCVCLYMHIRVCVSVHVYLYACVSRYVHLQMCIYVCVCACVFCECMRMHTCAQVLRLHRLPRIEFPRHSPQGLRAAVLQETRQCRALGCRQCSGENGHCTWHSSEGHSDRGAECGAGGVKRKQALK